MSYTDILRNIGLTIETLKDKKDIRYAFDPSFLDSFNDFYEKALFEINDIKEKSNDHIDYSKNILMDHFATLSEINDKLTNEIADLSTIKFSKDEEIHQDLLVQNESYNNQIQDENKKILESSEKAKQAILSKTNVIKIDNSNLESKERPNQNVYNYYIEYFNKISDDTYKQAHSSLSKSQYNLINANNQLIKHLDDKMAEYNIQVNYLKELIEKEKAKLQLATKEIETQLNEKIKTIVARYNKLKEQNETQTQLEINDIKIDIKAIEDKYTRIIKTLNQNASLRLSDIDTKIDYESKKLNQIIQDKIYHNNIKQKLDIEKINSMKEDLRRDSSNISISNRIKRKREIRHEEKEMAKERAYREREILGYQKGLKSLTYSALHNKQTIDIRRKYQINVKNIDESTEKYPLLKRISISDNEKNGFNKILDNELNKEINKEKLQAEIKILQKQSNFNTFDARTQIEITRLLKESYNTLIDKNLSLEIQKIISSSNNDKDELAKRNSNNIGLLNIEKNKHLLDMNRDLIKANKEANNLYLEHYSSIKKIENKRVNDLANENISYNNSALNMYRYIKNNELALNYISYKNKVNIKEAQKNYTIATEKHDIQVKRGERDISLMEENLKVFYDLAKSFKETFLPQFSTSLTNLKLGKKITKNYKNYFFTVITTFKNIIQEFNSREIKILDDHIRLDTGTKYTTIYSNIEYQHNQRISNEEKEISQLKQTIANYQNGIASFYNQIRDRSVKMNIEYNNKTKATKLEQKNIRKRIFEYKIQINSYQDKITQNTEKIISLRKEIAKHNKKISIYSKDRLHKLAITRVDERKESIVSLKTIDTMNLTTKKYIQFFDSILKTSFLENLVLNDKHYNKYYAFIKRVENGLVELSQSYKKCINEYKTNLAKSLDNLKKNYNKAYQNSLKIISRENQKDEKFNKNEALRLERNFYQNSVTHRENVDIIESKIKNLTALEHQNYENNKLKLDLANKELMDNYFLHFKSCDDLIKYSNIKYKTELEELNKYENVRTDKLLTSMQNKKNEQNKEHGNIIRKYQNEIRIIPKYNELQNKKQLERFNEQNSALNFDSNNTKQELKNFANKSKTEVEQNQKDNRKKIHQEYFNYKKNIQICDLEYKDSQKEVSKLTYKRD